MIWILLVVMILLSVLTILFGYASGYYNREIRRSQLDQEQEEELKKWGETHVNNGDS